MRTTVASTSAAVLCLGSLLAGCGSAPDKGYVAVGAAGPGDAHAPGKAQPPDDDVELTPLDGDNGGGKGGRDDSGAPGPSRDSTSGPPGGDTPSRAPTSGADGAGDTGGTDAGTDSGSGADSGANSGDTNPSDPANSPPPSGHSSHPGSPATPKPPSPTIPAGKGAPAGLLIGKPDLGGTDVRWCQKVTLDLLNTGDHPVTTGTVTFGSHIIGALGVDWATRHSTHKLPLPLAPGEKKSASWRVCVDDWRVPLGMHLDTRDVEFGWK